MNKEFQKYAVLQHRISSMTMHRYQSVLDAYINPTIIEERKLNVASMDVFIIIWLVFLLRISK